jgi:hypothetical protein
VLFTVWQGLFCQKVESPLFAGRSLSKSFNKCCNSNNFDGKEDDTTNCLTLWSRVLLVTLIVTHLLKKFPTFYATHTFITIFTRACSGALCNIHDKLLFYSEELLIPSPSPCLFEDSGSPDNISNDECDISNDKF